MSTWVELSDFIQFSTSTWATNFQFPTQVFNFQLRAFNFSTSTWTFNFELSTSNFQLRTFNLNFQLRTSTWAFNFQPSTVNCQLSIVNFRLQLERSTWRLQFERRAAERIADSHVLFNGKKRGRARKEEGETAESKRPGERANWKLRFEMSGTFPLAFSSRLSDLAIFDLNAGICVKLQTRSRGRCFQGSLLG